jgi:hypothetical protein
MGDVLINGNEATALRDRAGRTAPASAMHPVRQDPQGSEAAMRPASSGSVAGRVWDS